MPDSLATKLTLIERDQLSFDRRLTNTQSMLTLLDTEFKRYREEEQKRYARIEGGIMVIQKMIPIAAGALSLIVVVVNYLANRGLL